MKSIDEVDTKELKNIIRRVNETGVLAAHIKYNGIKNVVVYNNFVEAMNGLDEEATLQLFETYPEALTYYNGLFDEDDLTTVEEEEPDPEPEVEEPTGEVVDPAAEPEIVEIPTKKEPEPEPEKEKPATDRKRLSKTPMHPKIDGINLTVTFKELGISESFTLPKQGDKEGLRAVRKSAFTFAEANGATKGQIQHISKELNDNSYYMRGAL